MVQLASRASRPSSAGALRGHLGREGKLSFGAVPIHRAESGPGGSGREARAVGVEQLRAYGGGPQTAPLALHGMGFESVWEQDQAGSGCVSEVKFPPFFGQVVKLIFWV